MISLSAHVGRNPLLYHHPNRLIKNKIILTIGDHGDIVAWNHQQQNWIPIYCAVPSIGGDSGKIQAIICSPLRVLNQQEVTTKIVTIHEDNRLRIWNLDDGICMNISHIQTFPAKISQIVENSFETRFIFVLGQQCIYILDSWSMRIIDTLKPKVDTFVKFIKGKVSQQLQIEIYDNHDKVYKIDVSPIFNHQYLDVGSYVSNPIKAFEDLQKMINNLKASKLNFIRIADRQTFQQKFQQKSMLSEIGETLKKMNQNNEDILENIIDENFKQFLSPDVKEIFNKQKPVVSNIFFVKGSKMWFVCGMKSGRLIGMPCIQQNEDWGIFTHQPTNRSLKYITYEESNLICSWQNGLVCVYNLENYIYVLEQHYKKRQGQRNQIINMDSCRVFMRKLPTWIKHSLSIYKINAGQPAQKVMNILAYQLMSNEIVLYDPIHKQLDHFRGGLQNVKIYCILMHHDYIGIAHQKGIDMYDSEHFQRTISYQDWVWNDFKMFDKIDWPKQYHWLQYKSVIGTDLIEYSNRRIYRQINYSQPGNIILYETLGIVSDNEITNQGFPDFHFQHRIFAQNSVAARNCQKPLCAIKLKHDSVKRQFWKNTSFIIWGNLNRYLQYFDGNYTQELINDFLLYSLYFWQSFDQYPNFLNKIFLEVPFKCVLKKRLAIQGISKTFTIFFDNKERFSISDYVFTCEAICSTAFMQICANKDFSLTDKMVSLMQFYTKPQYHKSVKLNPDILSKKALSDNHNIAKASINLLMSTVIIQGLNLHPIYDYFILNIKNFSEKKINLLTVTETHWLVLMGIGMIYGVKGVEEQQIRTIIHRIMQSIDLANFELKPELVAVILKVLNEGISKWRSWLNSQQVQKLLLELFRVFFYYDGIGTIPLDDKKFNFCFEKVPQTEIKKMKQSIIRSIIYISKEFSHQFLHVLKTEALCQKIHHSYPASVIQILRQFIKSQKPKNHLVFYVELLLQCLSPMNPQLRKYVQKNVLSTLQLMCLYKTISFNQPSQKLSLLTSNHIYIYCLRTSTKWRTINIKAQKEETKKQQIREHEQRQSNISGFSGITGHTQLLEKNENNMLLEMSPKGTYIALLLNKKLQIWRLSSGFWSGVLGAFSQGWSFQADGIALKWQQSQQSISVINQNPSLSKNYKL